MYLVSNSGAARTSAMKAHFSPFREAVFIGMAEYYSAQHLVLKKSSQCVTQSPTELNFFNELPKANSKEPVRFNRSLSHKREAFFVRAFLPVDKHQRKQAASVSNRRKVP